MPICTSTAVFRPGRSVSAHKLVLNRCIIWWWSNGGVSPGCLDNTRLILSLSRLFVTTTTDLTIPVATRESRVKWVEPWLRVSEIISDCFVERHTDKPFMVSYDGLNMLRCHSMLAQTVACIRELVYNGHKTKNLFFDHFKMCRPNGEIIHNAS